MSDTQPLAPLSIEYSERARAIYERDLMLRRKAAQLPESDPARLDLIAAFDRSITVYRTEFPEVTP